MEIEKPDLTAMHRSELEGTVVSQAKLIERFRTGIACIVDDIEDDGDRAYFGSTNDADELRDLCSSLTDSGNELLIPWMHGDDLYADLAQVRAENAKMWAALEAIAADDIAMTNWTDEQIRGWAYSVARIANSATAQAALKDTTP